MMGSTWMGIASNGGACLHQRTGGPSGVWPEWSGRVQLVGRTSARAAAGITAGLSAYGVRGEGPAT
jgi:hypothetical protein